MSDTSRTDKAFATGIANATHWQEDHDAIRAVCCQLERELAEARNAALEEAAALCHAIAMEAFTEREKQRNGDCDYVSISEETGRYIGAEECERAILALKNAAPKSAEEQDFSIFDEALALTEQAVGASSPNRADDDFRKMRLGGLYDALLHAAPARTTGWEVHLTDEHRGALLAFVRRELSQFERHGEGSSSVSTEPWRPT